MMLSQSFLYNLNQIGQNLSTEENEISTGKALTEPSDNPLAISQDLAIRSATAQTNGYLSVIQIGLSDMKTTQTVLQNMTNTLQSIRDVVLQASNTTNQTPAQILANQQSVAQMMSNMYQLVDTKQGDVYLFGGQATDQQVSPYVATNQLQTNVMASSATASAVGNGGTLTIIGGLGTAEVALSTGDSLNQVVTEINAAKNQTGAIASVVTNASGNSQLVLSPQTAGTPVGASSSDVTVASSGAVFAIASSTAATLPIGASANIDLQVSASVQERTNVTGEQIFAQTPAHATADLRTTLQSILDDIGNPAALQTDLVNLDANSKQLVTLTTELGARMDQMQTLQTQTQSFASGLATQQATIENADMPQVMVSYQNQMATYQAALKMGSELMLPSLVQYI